jgi:hypothetical protein
VSSSSMAEIINLTIIIVNCKLGGNRALSVVRFLVRICGETLRTPPVPSPGLISGLTFELEALVL